MTHKNKKILFICGYSFLLESYALRLRQNYFEVYSLEDANDDFITKVAEIKPDLIYLYIVLPGRDGFEALKLLKKDPRTKDIPVIFENKKNKVEDIITGIDLGAIDYLVDEYTDTEIVARTAMDYLKNPNNYITRYPIFVEMLKAKHLDIRISEIVKEKLLARGIGKNNYDINAESRINTLDFYNSKPSFKNILIISIIIILMILLRLYLTKRF